MSVNERTPVLITGANGHLGKKLIEALHPTPVRALVRSHSAGENLANWINARNLQGADIVQCDYLDIPGVAAAANGCGYAVHLVGIIKEAGANTFERAHVSTTAALLQALAGSGVQRVCYLSLLGATADATNACLASRAQAEQLLLGAGIPALVLRIPMVLGAGDYASRALAAKARASLGFTFRGSSLEQPIDAGDVITAITRDIERTVRGSQKSHQLLELAGPESLSRKALVRRAGDILGTRPKIISLPLALGRALAWLLEKSSQSPPLSRAMLEILDHDDAIDPLPACRELGIELTPLDTTLAQVLEIPPAATDSGETK
jgi:NADH dehydrogenase